MYGKVVSQGLRRKVSKGKRTPRAQDVPEQIANSLCMGHA